MSRVTLVVRAALAAIVGSALVVTGIVVPSAGAATARPVAKAFPANEQVHLSWSAVAGTKSYTVDISRSSSFTDVTHVRTTARSVTVHSLTNGHTYYARVRSDVRGSSYSSSVDFRPTSRGAATSAKVTAAGTDKIKVSWTALQWGTRAYIIASYSNEAMDAGSATRWTVKVPITSTSAVLTIPASYRDKVGSKTGNPVFVRVVTYNDTTRYRSKVAFGFPTPPAVKETASSIVTVASMNIQGVRASQNFPDLTWMDRRKQATAAISRIGASVIAVQEASTAPVNGTRHYLDVADLLAPSGYELAYASSVVGTAGPGAMKGAQLYYRPSDLEVLDSGLKSTKEVAARYSPTTKWLNASGGQETDRYFAWALMRSRTSHVEFYIVSLHLQVGQATNNVRVRTAAALGIHKYMLAKAKAAHLSTAPMIVAGDWNTDVEKHPGGPTTQYIGFGYQDAAASANTTNRKYSSTNDQNTKADYGYPKKPVPYTYVGTRIDHIMVRGGAGSKSYDNVLVLRSDGSFDPRYQGSDHNIQVARISLL